MTMTTAIKGTIETFSQKLARKITLVTAAYPDENGEVVRMLDHDGLVEMFDKLKNEVGVEGEKYEYLKLEPTYCFIRCTIGDITASGEATMKSLTNSISAMSPGIMAEKRAFDEAFIRYFGLDVKKILVDEDLLPFASKDAPAEKTEKPKKAAKKAEPEPAKEVETVKDPEPVKEAETVEPTKEAAKETVEKTVESEVKPETVESVPEPAKEAEPETPVASDEASEYGNKVITFASAHKGKTIAQICVDKPAFIKMVCTSYKPSTKVAEEEAGWIKKYVELANIQF